MTVTFDAGRVLRTMLGLVCLALLTSIGGAGIFAAPVTLPLLWFAGVHARPVGRMALNAVAVLTAMEAFWAVAYFAGGEGSALMWVLPLAAGAAVFAVFPLTQVRLARRFVARPA